jgi:hypothetical protein
VLDELEKAGIPSAVAIGLDPHDTPPFTQTARPAPPPQAAANDAPTL